MKKWTRDGAILRASQDYGLWAKDAAKATGSMFIDLNEIIAEQYDALGVGRVGVLFTDDPFHTNAAGAEINAAAVVSGLKGLPSNPLASYFAGKANAAAPFMGPH